MRVENQRPSRTPRSHGPTQQPLNCCGWRCCGSCGASAICAEVMRRATSSPWSTGNVCTALAKGTAAKLHHMDARVSSCGMPGPKEDSTPRLVCALPVPRRQRLCRTIAARESLHVSGNGVHSCVHSQPLFQGGIVFHDLHQEGVIRRANGDMVRLAVMERGSRRARRGRTCSTAC